MEELNWDRTLRIRRVKTSRGVYYTLAQWDARLQPPTWKRVDGAQSKGVLLRRWGVLWHRDARVKHPRKPKPTPRLKIVDPPLEKDEYRCRVCTHGHVVIVQGRGRRRIKCWACDGTTKRKKEAPV